MNETIKDLALGIDTSNYKTSAAVVDKDRTVLFERSLYLHVDKGKRGLRQSEAFFMHSNRLPGYFKDMFEEIDPARIAAIGVSSRPRRIEGSYMPCFLAGMNAAREIGAALRVPVFEFSHQEGHAAAVIESNTPFKTDDAAGADDSTRGTSGVCYQRSLLFHLSGGTTEFLLCRPDERGYSLEIAGGTKDISIGQLVDRAGVAMGFDFPSGMYLDELASAFDEGRSELPGVVKPVKIKDAYFNLSGSEAQIMRALEARKGSDTDTADDTDGADAESPSADPYYSALSYELFDMIARLLASSASELAAKYSAGCVYMAGGVASSAFIRKHINNYISGDMPSIIFAEPSLSGDNAVGTAILAARQGLKDF